MNRVPYRTVNASAGDPVAKLYIYGDIGEDWDCENSNSAKDILSWVSSVDVKTPIQVYLNSYGGSVSDALAIYSLLTRHPGGVDCQVDGVAMSSATIILMAGRTRSVVDHALVMTHAPWTWGSGNAEEFRQTAGLLDQYAEAMMGIYTSGVSEERAREWLFSGEEFFFSAQEAVEVGLATEIVHDVPVAAAYFRNRYTMKHSNTGACIMSEKAKTPEEVLSEERNRVAQIHAIAARYEVSSDAVSTAVSGGESPSDFERKALAERVDTLTAQLASAAAPSISGVMRPSSASSGEGRIEAPSPRNRTRRVFRSDAEAMVVGHFALAVLRNAPKSITWLRENRGLNAQGLSLTSGGTAGVLIPTELENAIVDLREEYGVLRQYARVVPMGSDTLTRAVKTTGLTATPIGEGGIIAASDLENMWKGSSLVARKWGVLVRYPSELDDDAIIDLAEDLASDMGMAFAEAEDSAGFVGDGSSTYHGILGLTQKIILAAHAGAVVEATGNTFADVTITDIAKLMALVPRRFRRNAAFFCSRVGYTMTLMRLKAAAGGNTASDLSEADLETFMRYPVVETETMPSVFTTLAGEVMIAFGDARAACDLGNRRGIRLLESRERYLETDEIALQATQRFDLNWHSCGTATAPGPVAALIGKTT